MVFGSALARDLAAVPGIATAIVLLTGHEPDVEGVRLVRPEHVESEYATLGLPRSRRAERGPVRPRMRA
jgi:hypothetical protein